MVKGHLTVAMVQSHIYGKGSSNSDKGTVPFSFFNQLINVIIFVCLQFKTFSCLNCCHFVLLLSVYMSGGGLRQV